MAMYANGQQVSGCTSYASAVNYIEEDGSKSTVQDKISELSSKLGIYNIDEIRAGYEQSADIVFSQWKKGDVIWSFDALCSNATEKARLMVSLNNGTDWIELWKLTKDVTVNFTMHSTVNSELKVASYPDGFNKDNCIIIGGCQTDGNGYYYAPFNQLTVILKSDGIYAYLANQNVAGVKVKAVLRKIT